MSEVAEYLTSEEEDEEELVQNPQSKTHRNWIREATFLTTKAAKDFIQNEASWSIDTSTNSEEGKKNYYRCNKVKSRGTQCKGRVYLLEHCSSSKVSLIRAEEVHTHDSIETKSKSGISEETKARIKELWSLKQKPKAIEKIYLVQRIPIYQL